MIIVGIRVAIWIISLLLVTSCSLAPVVTPTPNIEDTNKGKVVGILDGNTIEVQVNDLVLTVKFIGIDSEGTEGVHKLALLSKEVWLEYDTEVLDQAKNYQAYIWLEKSTDLKKMYNYLLVRSGYAEVLSLSLNTKYDRVFQEAQRLAKQDHFGMWR